MTMPVGLLDTDILSALMRQNPAVTARAKSYLNMHGRLTFSIITRYEILRGLYAKAADKQIESFNKLCERSYLLSISDEIIVKAAEIYGVLHQRGELISDADILIGASALVNGTCVVTNNLHHFQRIPGLTIENWLDVD